MKRKAIIALSFDDGRADNYNIVKEILIPKGLPSTLFITTGYVDGTCEESLLPTRKNAMTVQEVQELSREPLVEIGLHGDKHLNELEDIIESRNKMIRWLSAQEKHRFGFASPSSRFPLVKLEGQEDSTLYKSLLSYVAVGPRFEHMRTLRILARKASRVIPSGLLFSFAYCDTLMPLNDEFAVFRVPILAGITVHQVEALIKKAIVKQMNLVLMFHSIEESTQDNWEWSKKKFIQLCSFLNAVQEKQQAEIMTVGDMLEK